MKHEKIIKDERGKFRVEVRIWTSDMRKDHDGNDFRYDVFVGFTPIGKRKEEPNNYDIYLTEKQILDVKLELWNKLKPLKIISFVQKISLFIVDEQIKIMNRIFSNLKTLPCQI